MSLKFRKAVFQISGRISRFPIGRISVLGAISGRILLSCPISGMVDRYNPSKKAFQVVLNIVTFGT